MSEPGSMHLISPAEYTEEAQLHSVNMQECLRLILERGGDVTCYDAQGMTPLHWALQFPSQCAPNTIMITITDFSSPFVSGNMVACSLLLSNGADPKAKDNLGLTGNVPLDGTILNLYPDTYMYSAVLCGCRSTYSCS